MMAVSSNKARLLPVKEPVDGENNGDILWWEPHCVEHHHHGDQPGLGDAGSSYTGGRGRDGDGSDLTDAEGHSVDLRDEDGRHSLVQSCAVHVDGGTDREDEPGADLK